MFNLYAAHRISPRFARASCVATTCPAHVSRKTCSSRCDEPTRNTMTHAYPLAWPAGWPRTAQTQRRRARYHVSLARARDDLLQELQRLGASGTLISTDLPLRRDGLPLASAREPMDPGVAVYFTLHAQQHVIACDSWALVKDNLRAVGLTVHALRQRGRAGAGGGRGRAGGGGQGLPPPRAEDAPPPWRDVLDMGNDLNDPGDGLEPISGSDARRELGGT